jgi:transcriptional regulator with XRE-family HTH domain
VKYIKRRKAMNISYHERDYTYGTAILFLRTAIGLTQEGLANHLSISRQAVGKWLETSYLALAHLLKLPEEKEREVDRIVQAVKLRLEEYSHIRESMDAWQLRMWTERVVRAVNAASPEAEFEQWSRCEQLLSHALVCVTWIEHCSIAPAEAAHLLRKAGNYLRQLHRWKLMENPLRPYGT